MTSFTPSRRPVRYVVGIDIGGTNIVAGTVAEDGSELLGLVSEPTFPEQGADAVMTRIVKLTRASMAAARGKEIAGVGIGSPGPLDTKTGVVLLTPNLGWTNFPLRDRITQALGLPATLDNDANCAIFGEWWRGAARGANHVGGLTIGTGIGGGVARAAARRSAPARVQAGCGRVPDRARRADGHGRRVRGGRRVRQAHAGERVKRLGVIGSMVWDTIYGRDPARPAIEEWGGISYSLAALDATLRDDWQIVPLVKVGRDLAARANEFLGTMDHVGAGAPSLEVAAAANRVTLRYYQAERRCEQMSGGVPPWTWPELGPQVRDLDAVYVNFISGYELDLDTAQLLRRGFSRFLYADLHSLFLGKEPDGTRVPQPLPDAPAWFGCFDVVQLNEDELAQLGPDPLLVAAGALARGCQTLVVTLGPRGAAYFPGRPVRSAR